LLLASDFSTAKATVLRSVSSSRRLVCAQSKLFWRGCPIFSPTEAASLSVPAWDLVLASVTFCCSSSSSVLTLLWLPFCYFDFPVACGLLEVVAGHVLKLLDQKV
jgi:hypothetical protein